MNKLFADNILWVSILIAFIALGACQRDDYYEGRDVDLAFSQDTLRIDTVFTTIGSATRYLKVYNPHTLPVLVDIKLENPNSFFRINVDGIQGPVVKNVEIGGNDSIYVFVEVTIDPDQPVSVSPFIIEDRINVSVNGITSSVVLEAWGQNANYITPSNGKGNAYLLSCNFGEQLWDDPKPYVIYGILYIDSCKIVLPPGTRIYVHGGIIRNESQVYNDGLLIFLKDGSLDSRGTPENPVVFQGDRLEESYKDVKSQWAGLMFWQESTQNILSCTTIKNAIIGVRTDSLSQLIMKGCSVFNTGGPCVASRYSDIYAENCLFYGSASYCLQLTYGGRYEFNYCTVGSFEGNNEAVILTDYYTTDPFNPAAYRTKPLQASFTNSVLTGSDEDEINLINWSGNPNSFIYKFTNSAFRVKDLVSPKNIPDFFDFTQDCLNLKGNEKLFSDFRKNNYRPDSMSVLLNKGIGIDKIKTDIEGKTRKSTPDIGCYEL